MNETVNSFDQAYSDIESMKSLSQELRKELEVTRNVIEGSKAGAGRIQHIYQRRYRIGENHVFECIISVHSGRTTCGYDRRFC